ncbi:MAG: DUF2760 domain-containing protein [Polyangiaceae bacterium]|nr:DUF2760 domain-containing protein [Polyangiaceae bacterium]
MTVPQAPPPDFVTRLWFAWACFFRVLFDGSFAGRAWAVRDAMPELEPARMPKQEPAPSKPKASETKQREREARVDEAKVREEGRTAGLNDGRSQGALSMLSLLQTEGRFVDFLQQDIASFDDQDVGAAARVVHEGCRKALRERVEIVPILADKEGTPVTLEPDFDAHAIKLTGNVRAESSAVKGTLRHKGWRAKAVKLPEPTKGHVHEVLYCAEVEL